MVMLIIKYNSKNNYGDNNAGAGASSDNKIRYPLEFSSEIDWISLFITFIIHRIEHVLSMIRLLFPTRKSLLLTEYPDYKQL